MVKFVFQRHLESVLYGRTEGSSGPIWKMLNATGMGTTALPVSKASVVDELISQAEYDHLMQIFKSTLPASIVDPSSLGRIRVCTLLPLATAARTLQSRNRIRRFWPRRAICWKGISLIWESRTRTGTLRARQPRKLWVSCTAHYGALGRWRVGGCA